MKSLCVVFGGQSAEHDISIITGMQLCNKIKSKYKVQKLYLGLDNKFYLATDVDDISYFLHKDEIILKPVIIYNNAVYHAGVFLKKLFDIECIINCCHGGVGENGNLAAFFEVNNITYTSADPLSSQIAMDKSLAKLLVKDIVSTIKGVKITKQNYNQLDELIKDFSSSLIVKPNSLGSSIGVGVCDKQTCKQQIDAIFLLNDSALVEEQITDMVEYNQAVLFDGKNLIASAIESPQSSHNVLTFDDKYQSKHAGKDRQIPAQISKQLANKISLISKQIYTRLNMNGVVRIDYIFDKSTKTLYFNEINTIPGSMAFYLFEPLGIDYISLVETLIASATHPKQYTYFNSDILSKKI